jgi:hypothetical protein
LVKLHAGCQNAATVAVDGVPHVDPKGKVLAVGEARKSLARACEELGVERLTHHDLRDAFATSAIEAGVDIPTVAAWLGHAYGGALLICVYGVIDPVQRESSPRMKRKEWGWRRGRTADRARSTAKKSSASRPGRFSAAAAGSPRFAGTHRRATPLGRPWPTGNSH